MNKYIRQFFRMSSADNLTPLFSGSKRSAKEITESLAMQDAAIRFHKYPFEETTVIVVGDGSLPRTGAIFAYTTKANVTSVDPELNNAKWETHKLQQAAMGYPIQRLEVIKNYIENLEFDLADKHCIVVWPHSHADMNHTRITAKTRMDIAMPCCQRIPDNWEARPHISYRDFCVSSPKNKVYIWHDPAIF